MTRALLTLLLAFSAAGAGVDGVVYAPDGTPVVNAVVTAYIPEGSAEQLQRQEKRGTRAALATTKTENGGRFALAELPDSIVDVDVRAEGFAPVAVRTLAGDAPLSITLQPSPLVEGRVTAARKPVANAYVVWLGANDVEYTTTTDESGRYRAPDVRRWVREPRVFHPQFGTLIDAGRGADGLNLELQSRRPEERPRPAGNATLTGVVKLGEKPLAGVPVLIQGTGEQFVPAVRVVTDAKGRYRATGLLPVRTFVAPAEGLEPRIRARSGRMAVEGSEPSLVDLSKKAEATLDLTLTKAPMITGRVIDVEGKPVAAAEVQVVLAGRSTFDFMHDGLARTSVDGRYAVAAPPFEPAESVNVAVSAPRRSTVRSKTFILGSGNHQVDVTLPRLQAVTLRVVDRAGKPVPNALVAFADSEEIAGFRDARALLMQPFVTRASRADAWGEVHLQLAAGTYDFAAEAENFQPGILVQRGVARATTIDLPLEQAFAIRGRVHRDGTGVANVIIRVLGHEGAMQRDVSAVTGADGRFELTGLARDKYRLGAFKQEELIQRTIDAEAPGTVDIALPPAAVLRGRVVDAVTREPVREFVYSIEQAEPTDENVRHGRPMMQRAEPSGDGTFTVTLAAGVYNVTAGANGYTLSTPLEVRLTEREPADIEIRLERGGTITGRVTDDSGMPVAGANVFVAGAELERIRSRSSPRVGPGNTRTADDGTYTVTSVEPGTASMTVRKEGYVPFRRAIEVQAMTTVDVRLERGLTIEGVVLRGGKPVPEAGVGATTAAVGGDHQPAITDENGRFVLRGLIAARYTVAAYRDDVHAEVKDVDPTQRKELVITLDPRPTGVIFGTVTGIPATLGGKIMRRAVFVQSNDRGVEGMIDEGGNYRIENAPTGRVFVTAQLESTTGGRSSMRKEVELMAGSRCASTSTSPPALRSADACRTRGRRCRACGWCSRTSTGSAARRPRAPTARTTPRCRRRGPTRSSRMRRRWCRATSRRCARSAEARPSTSSCASR
jgi:protocatechuate 3,4-dioxygenase beta subunit